MNEMNDRITVFLGGLVGVVLVALVGGIALLLASQGQPVQAQGSGVNGMRQITVIGSGEARSAPDTARVEIGVETNAETTAEAIEENNTQTQAVIDRMTDLGVEERDIQTSNFNMYARYDDEGQDVIGYNVSNIVSVTIRDLEAAGSLLDEVVQVGANRIYGIQFLVDDPSSLLEAARDNAMEDARTKAERLAEASGATLGEVLVITENIGADSPVPVGRGGDMMQESAASVPVQGGEQSYQARIQITFALR